MSHDPRTRRHDVETEDQELEERDARDEAELEPLDTIVEGEIPDEDDAIVEREEEDE